MTICFWRWKNFGFMENDVPTLAGCKYSVFLNDMQDITKKNTKCAMVSQLQRTQKRVRQNYEMNPKS